MKYKLNCAFGVNLNQDLGMLAQVAQQWASFHLAPLANEMSLDKESWRSLWRHMGEQGFLGITVAKDEGGQGLSFYDHLQVMAAFSIYSPAIALSYAAHSNLCIHQISEHGLPAQKQRYLQPLIRGEAIGALAISECESGSDAMSLRLRAERVEGGYRLYGDKLWITNAPIADVMVVYARTDTPSARYPVTAFVVDCAAEGLTIGEPIAKDGMVLSPTSELRFEGCWVPEEQRLGQEGQGASILMSGLDSERLVLMGGPLGIMQSCLDKVLPYVSERQQFGKSIADHGAIQAKIADMYTAFRASQSYAESVAKQFGCSTTRQDVASALLFVSEQATKVVDMAIQCLGANGYTKAYGLGRLWHDAKLYDIGGGTNEIRRYLIARECIKSQPEEG